MLAKLRRAEEAAYVSAADRASASEDALAISSSERQCCVCFAPTADVTPCGHVLCCACRHTLKSKLCPMCRRPLPALPPIDYAALVRDAFGADLSGLQRAYQMTRNVFTAEATGAKESILAIVAERLWTFGLLDLCNTLDVLPMQEPVVWTAIGNRLDVLASQIESLDGLHYLACNVQPLRQASPALESTVDRAVSRAMQHVVSTSSLRELWAGVTCFRSLASNPSVDANLLAMTLHDTLQRSVACNFNISMAQDFVGIVGALASWNIFSKSMETYIAHLFSARVAAFVSAASLEELDWIEDKMLPQLPSNPIWKEASDKILSEVTRQTERLTRLGGAGRLSLEASFADRRREARVQAVLQGMQRIDAGIQKEALDLARFR